MASPPGQHSTSTSHHSASAPRSGSNRHAAGLARGPEYATSSPSPAARCATIAPMAPSPTTPTFIPLTRRDGAILPSAHCPLRTKRSASTTRRTVAYSSAMAVSAVSVRTASGVCRTAMPRRAASAVSMRSSPTPRQPSTRRFGSRARAAASAPPTLVVMAATIRAGSAASVSTV